MARGINKVILVGNLGADPTVRYNANNEAVANIRIATTESWKNRTTGERQDRTEWHNVVLFGNLATIGAQYLRSGSQVYIEGRLRTRKWQDQNNQDRYTTEIVALDMQMLGKPAGQSEEQEQEEQAEEAAPPVQQPAPAQQKKTTAASAPAQQAAPATGKATTKTTTKKTTAKSAPAAQQAAPVAQTSPEPEQEQEEQQQSTQDGGFDDDIPF